MVILDVIVFLLCLGILILIHEMGHFLFARCFGIGVKKFSIGFGKKLFSFGKDKFGTEYVLSLIPLGGYVELEGENPLESKGDSREFVSKPIWQRAMVIGAGPLVNYFFGFLLFVIVYVSGAPEVLPVVGDVLKDSVAESVGMMKGDIILEVNGVKVDLWDEMVKIIRKHPGEQINILIRRGDKTMQLFLTPDEVPGLGGEKIGRMGIVSDPSAYIVARFPLSKAIKKAWMRASQISFGVVRGIYLLFRGDKQIRKTIAGPIGIYDVTSRAMHLGFNVLLLVIASLSVSLAVFNLLPIPVLDGGHLLFLGMEAIYRKRLPEKLYIAMYHVGMAVVIALMVLVLWNDVKRVKNKLNKRLLSKRQMNKPNYLESDYENGLQ